MCGLAGEINLFEKVKINKSILKEIAHRGPDNSSILQIDKNLCFYHTRLKIIDLSNHSNQPITSRDGRYVIIYNGELYNYLEIKKKLEKKGYLFNTLGDTEVFLYGFIEYGKNFFKIANGIFSVAIYDKKFKKLYLARDFIGVKPLYYYFDNKRLIFASEAKGVCKLLNKSNKLNKDLINEYLFYKYISGTKTLIKNIYQLEPGVICSIDLKNKNIKLNKKQYYYFKEEDNRDSIPEAVNKTKNLLEKSINLQLQCDANLGIQLSGGIDSTVIAEMANRKKNINYSYLNSFDNYELDESNYADKVSKKLSISLKKIKIDKKYFFKNLLKAIYFLDEPLNHPHSVAMLKISEIAKKNVSVVLAGEGADEIFYGYERYKTLNSNSDINKIIKNGAFIRKNSDLNNFENFYNPLYGETHANRIKIYNNINIENKIKKIQYFECLTHLQSLLLRSDKMMMSNSIEARVPFLDINLFNYAINLSDKIKKNRHQKIILKKILENLGYNKKFIYRKKIGYLLPLNNWLKNKKNYINELNNPILKDIFCNKKLNNLSINLNKGKNLYSNAKTYWSLINLKKFINIFNLDI